MCINEEIKKLIPHFCEDLITFPLWEEGDRRPTVKIWRMFTELPKEIKDNSKFDLDIVGCENKELFYVRCDCETIGGKIIDFGITKIQTEEKINVDFSIYNSADILDDQSMNLEKLIEVANLINTYYNEI